MASVISIPNLCGSAPALATISSAASVRVAVSFNCMKENLYRKKKSFVTPLTTAPSTGQYLCSTSFSSTVTPKSNFKCDSNRAFQSYNVDTDTSRSAHISPTVFPVVFRCLYSQMTPSTNKRLYCMYGMTTSGKIACVLSHSLHIVRLTSINCSFL